MKSAKKAYRRPQLVEYGKLAEVTQGWFGNRQDNGFFQAINAIDSDGCSAPARALPILCGTQSS